jgi:hypothetical protein
MTRFLPTCKPSTWILILGLFVGLSVLLWPNLAFAQNFIEATLFFMVANLTGWMLWMGGSLLDYGLNTFVINFGTIFQTGGVGVAVDQLWAMVRDLFNILFIFGLVYIGFKMILNSDDSQTKKTLISLIIAALLMNFSLFITKFVVDFTNILAAEIATAGFETVESGLEGSEKNVRVGDTFFGLMGIGPLVLEMPNNIGTGEQAAWSYIFGIGIINIVGAFAFGVGGIMLIIRFIALSVYMVLSPFMFLGMIFPGFQAMSSKYWSGFLKQAFYAPVYVVMIFFSATILNNLFRLETATQTGGSAQGAGIGDVVRSNSSIFSPAGSVSTIAENFAGGIGPFILSVGFLIAAVQVAGKLSADGSGVMAKVGGAVNSRVRGAVSYAPRRYAQYGVAAGGSTISGGVNLARKTRIGRIMTNNQLGAAAAGASQASRNVKFGANNSIRERQVAAQARTSQFGRDEKIARASKISADATDPKEIQMLADARTAANEYAVKDIEAMSSKQRTELVKYLKAPTISKLLESENLSNKEKGGIASKYKDIIESKVYEDGQLITEELQKLSVKQLEILGDEFIRDHSSMFAESQMDDLKKSDAFSEQQKGQQISERKKQLSSLAKNGSLTIKGGTGKKDIVVNREYLYKSSKRDDTGKHVMGNSLKPTELAARSYDAFVDDNGTIRPEARKLVSADVLKQIARNANLGKGSMSDDEREKLAYSVLSTPGIPSRVASYLKTEKGSEDFFLETKEIKVAEKKADENDIKEHVGSGTLGI